MSKSAKVVLVRVAKFGYFQRPVNPQFAAASNALRVINAVSSASRALPQFPTCATS